MDSGAFRHESNARGRGGSKISRVHAEGCSVFCHLNRAIYDVSGIFDRLLVGEICAPGKDTTRPTVGDYQRPGVLYICIGE